MKKFEYLTCLEDHRFLGTFLNNKGSEGWELVSATSHSLAGSQYRLIFKREEVVTCNLSAITAI